MKDTQKSWLNLVLMALMAGALVYLIIEPSWFYRRQVYLSQAA